MLQLAGLAAILNEIHPGLADRFTNSVKNKVSVPLTSTYKIGWTNGFIAGGFAGIAITIGARYAYIKYRDRIRDVKG